MFNYKNINRLLYKNLIKNKSLKKPNLPNSIDLYFKLSNNNSIASIVLNNQVVFWDTCKTYKTNKKFKAYSRSSIELLCDSLFQYIINKIELSRRFLNLRLFFKGLALYRWKVLKFFFRKNFKTFKIFILSNIAHNGIKSSTKRRLPKKKRLKVYKFNEFKYLKKKKLKKEKIIIKITHIDFIYIWDFILNLNSIFFYKPSFIFFTTNKTKPLSLLRSVFVYGSHRQKFLSFKCNAFIVFKFLPSSKRWNFLSLSLKKLFLYDFGIHKIKNHKKSFSF